MGAAARPRLSAAPPRQEVPELPLDTGVPALVVRTDANPFHHGTLAVLRTLGRAGVPVHVLSADRWAPAEASRYRASRSAWGVDPGDAEAAVRRLREVAGPLGRPVAVPVDDEGAILLASQAHRLADVLRLSPTPPGLPAQLADKSGLARLCAEHGVPTAAGTVVHGVADLEPLLARTQGPWVLKVARPWEHPGLGTDRVRHVATADDLRALLRAQPYEAVVQELVPATPGGDVMAMGHVSADGRADLALTAVKVRSFPPGAGQTCLGRAVQDDDLAARSLAAARAFGHVGVFDMDWRLDPRTGEHRLLDVNPRVGASFRVTQRVDGVDAVRALHLSLTGRELPDAPVQDGRGLLVEQYDLRAARHYVSEEGLRGWLRATSGPRELAWWAADDWRPFTGLLLRSVHRVVTRPR